MAALPTPSLGKLFTKHLIFAGVFCFLANLIWPGSWLSASLGAAIALLPQVVFALMVFRFRGAKQLKKMQQALFQAAVVKLGLAVVLFALVFLLVQPSNPISLLCTYVAVVLINWLNPWLIQNKTTTS